MRRTLLMLWMFCAAMAGLGRAQQMGAWPDLTHVQGYTLHRASSSAPDGTNADAVRIEPGKTLTVLDSEGPGLVSHIWFTINDDEAYALKRIVLRMYWDGEKDPSVETPIGDFFGLGLGEYYDWESARLSVGHDKALNCFFPMPFRHHARITVTNEGQEPVGSFYYNIDYRLGAKTVDANALYFHAQYRQAQPNHGWTTEWTNNGDPRVNNRPNLDHRDDYVFLDAAGSGQYVGITLSILQNQDDWWGEGDDSFFVDGEAKPSIAGTGAEDYFLGAWGFGSVPFAYQLYGAPVLGNNKAGSRWSVYRFHLDSPLPFEKSLKATLEHGHANHRSDNF